MQSTYQIHQPYAAVLPMMQEITSSLGEVDSIPFRVELAKPEDGYLVNLRDEQMETFNPADINLVYRTHAWLNILTPMNYTLYHGNQILVLMNVIPVAEGVGEINFLTDKYMVHASKVVKKALMLFFSKALEALPFFRLQAKVDSEFLIGQHFVERLGFEQEGVLRRFGNNKTDYIMYGLLKE